jgi:hypothetical protein
MQPSQTTAPQPQTVPQPADHVTQTSMNIIAPGYGPMITKEEFNARYWFTTMQLVTVLNPRWFKENNSAEPVSRDYPFMVELRHFIIREGATERLPGAIANVYLDQMSKIVAQNDDNLGFMADPALKKLYYDKLIVEVEDLMPQLDMTPAYLRNVPQSAQGQNLNEERAPWDASGGERASDAPIVPIPAAPLPPSRIGADIPSSVPQEPTTPSPVQTTPTVPEVKEFEQGGNKFKQVTGKDGRKMHYKDGRMTSEADYAKAASLL